MDPVTHRRRRCRATLSIWMVPILFVSPCLTIAETLEYDVKAAFLLNFTRFIEWPAGSLDGPDTPLSICILGDDPFGAALDHVVQGEVVNGRRVNVVRVKHLPPPKGCEVVFVAQQKDVKALAEVRPGVLTVGEGEGFLREGGMIAFVIEDRRVRFEVNRRAAETAGLKLSSQLLTVAKNFER
jgi:hypothetical protein